MSDDDDSPDAFDERLPEPDASAERRKLSRKQAKADRDREEEDGFWRTSLASPIGRRALFKLMQQEGLFEQPFACGPNGFPQPEATWFKAGRQSVIRDLHSRLQMLDHGAVYDMLCENHPAFVTAIRRTVKYG